MRTEFLCISVLGVASGPRVKLASCNSALNPPVLYSTDRSKAVVPVLVLLFVALWYILRGDLFYVLPCVILFLFFSVLLALRLPRLGKRAFHTFVRLALIWVCLFPLPLWCLGRAAVCDCGTPWTFLLPFLVDQKLLESFRSEFQDGHYDRCLENLFCASPLNRKAY